MRNASQKTRKFQVAVIGCGPAGLMAADVLSQAGLSVSMFDSMPSAGRKFLIASKGGLNLTHSLPFGQFLAMYREKASDLHPFLEKFGPEDLRSWISRLGFQTFEGSSGKIFPEDMNGGAILHAIMERLKSRAVEMHFEHKWTGWDEEKKQIFETNAGFISRSFDAIVFSFGGS
ncbi:MAG: FAD-binding protein, partial [Anaerolineaceae bacterium]|nr:FAD-binding protein [Anaerolineaceae bacterium]